MHFRIAAAIGIIGLLCAADVNGAEPVRIGFSHPETGVLAPIAASQLDAYELWRERVNATGGLNVGGKEHRRVIFVRRDDGSDPAAAASIYEELVVDDKVDLLLAPWGAANHMAVAGVVERHGYPLLATTAPTFFFDRLKANNMWFASAGPRQIAQAIVGYLKSQSVSKIALIVVDTPDCLEARLALLPALAGKGIEAPVQEILKRAAEVTQALSGIQSTSPGAVLFYGYPGDTALYLAAARALGFRPRHEIVLMGPQFDGFTASVGGKAEGVVFPAYWEPPNAAWPGAEAYRRAYFKKFGRQSDYFHAPLAYVGAEILEQAVRRVGLDKAALRKEIASGLFATINGPVRFEANRNAVTPPVLLRLRHGDVQAVWRPGKGAGLNGSPIAKSAEPRRNGARNRRPNSR